MAQRFLPIGVALLASALGAGCAGAPTQAGDADNFGATPTATAAADTPPAADARADKGGSKDEPLTEDQKAQMEIALRRGEKKAANCIGVAADAKSGKGEVTVLFDGKIGKAVDVTVGPPWAGIPLMESCLKRAFIGEYVMPFDGKLEVPFPLELGKTDAPAADPKKDAKKDSKKDPKKDPKKK